MNLAARFRPRADTPALSKFVQAAWQAESERVSAGTDNLELRERLTALLESLHPRDDMEVLRRWRYALETEKLTVSVFHHATGESYGRWDNRVSVELTRPVLVTASGGYANASLSTPAPWYFDEDLGLSEKRRAEMSADEWAEHVEDIKDKVARSVPWDLCAPFNAYAVARESYSREYRQATQWPSGYKAEKGDYPTWAQICDQFPITGAYIRQHGEI